MASSVAGARVDFSTKSVSVNDPVVSVDWLHANLKDPDLKVHALVASILLIFLEIFCLIYIPLDSMS